MLRNIAIAFRKKQGSRSHSASEQLFVTLRNVNSSPLLRMKSEIRNSPGEASDPDYFVGCCGKLIESVEK